jgi:hypothetical protein
MKPSNANLSLLFGRLLFWLRVGKIGSRDIGGGRNPEFSEEEGASLFHIEQGISTTTSR